MGNRNERLVRSISAELIQKEGLTLQRDSAGSLQLLVDGENPFENEPPDRSWGAPQYLWDAVSDIVRRKVKKLRPESIGRIAMTGKAHKDEVFTTLYEVRCGTYLGKLDSGRILLIEVAATAVVAVMWDLLLESANQAGADKAESA